MLCKNIHKLVLHLLRVLSRKILCILYNIGKRSPLRERKREAKKKFSNGENLTVKNLI